MFVLKKKRAVVQLWQY